MSIAVLVYLLIVNAVTFAAFASDKRRAVAGERRIPERTLLGLAAAGGTLGAFAARRWLRHKTRKAPFGARLWGIAAVQIVAACALGAWLRG